MRKISQAVLLAFSLLVLPAVPMAQEHPKEHPTGQQGAGITKEALARAIEGYVTKESTLKGGYFLVYDKELEKALVLKLDKVHKERLARVAPDVYFACADFATPKGKKYDLDIFMKGPDEAHLNVTQITIHKENGKERYTWMEEGGMWKMVPMGKAKSTTEHPKEHPSEHPHRF